MLLQLFACLQSQGCSFSTHVAGGGRAGNMRLFEGTGVGACMVTEDTENMSDLFVKDEEILAYRSRRDLNTIVLQALRNKRRAVEIGKRAQQKVLAHYTVWHMWRAIRNEF